MLTFLRHPVPAESNYYFPVTPGPRLTNSQSLRYNAKKNVFIIVSYVGKNNFVHPLLYILSRPLHHTTYYICWCICRMDKTCDGQPDELPGHHC